MKGTIKFLIGIFLGALLGWGLGFLRFPSIEGNHSFWVGFIACIATVLFIVALAFIWNKNSLLIRLIGKNSGTNDSQATTRIYPLIWIMVALFILTGGMVSSLMIYWQNKLMEIQAQDQNKRILEQSELIESIRKGNLVILMSSVLDNVHSELESHPDRTLSDATIARVTALSFSFKPYRYFDGDSLSNEKLSPERGQLLLALSIMNIDSVSFAKIKHSATFSYADLSRANLKNADFSGADLRGANLKDADLGGADLQGADLREANLWGANLNKANLSGANLKRADVKWADLNEANLKLANLDGVDLSNSKLTKADLRGATFQWAKAGGALFVEANLSGVNMQGTVLIKANLNKSDLRESNLRLVDLSEAHWEESDLTEARVGQENWSKILEEWHFKAAERIQKDYMVVSDTSGRFQYSRFLLKKTEAGK